LLSEAESRLAAGLEEGRHGRTSAIEDGVANRRLTCAGLVLVIPMVVIIAAEVEICSISLVLLLLIQERQPRSTYRPHIELEPKYNAALLIEKAKTGLSISKITELALKEYFSKNIK